jgi:glycyl-tRNA synthetase
MSTALYPTDGLRFWSEEEILVRDMISSRTNFMIKKALLAKNPAWEFFQIEGPILTPRSFVSPEYTGDDIFETNHEAAGEQLVLRGETTASSYTAARHLEKTNKRAKLPFCVYQVGKSFRREKADGASPSKLRFNEFYQAEWQCIYSVGTKADYRDAVIKEVEPMLARILGKKIRVVESDRLPSYSESTLDLEAHTKKGWREIASMSIRNDYSEETRVFEFALGLDRVVEIEREL